MAAVWWVLDVLKRHELFANLKKWRFYKDEIYFLEYVILRQKRKIKDEQIEAAKNWLEPKLIQYI